MAIGIGVDRLRMIMNEEFSKYRGTQAGLEPIDDTELATFDVAIPKLLNRHYKSRVSGVLYSTYAGSYLVALMRAKKLLGGGTYAGNDGEAGIVSKELTFWMFGDENTASPCLQKTKWATTDLPTATGWQPILGFDTSKPSVITNDEFGAMAITHVTTLADSPNVLELLYNINGNPRIPQYVEPAFTLNENRTYQLDIPHLLVKNTKLLVRANVETIGMPIDVMQGGIAFANANWFNSETPSMV
jgi:hypothetical protein